MAQFVPDASLTLAWCFEDETTASTDALLTRLKAGDEATVPTHWPLEVSNALLAAIRRNRITWGKAFRFFDDLRSLPIRIDLDSTRTAFRDIFVLAEEHTLTIYDAAYLELAIRKRLPLATLDKDLQRAARSAAVPLLGQR